MRNLAYPSTSVEWMCGRVNLETRLIIFMWKICPALSALKIGKSYLAGQFRQIKCSLAEQFRQIKCSLAEPQYVVEARAKMSLAIMSKILASGCTN